MDLNDSLADIQCELPKYPASRGPVTMASDQTGVVVACGEWDNSDYRECYIFDGTWEPLPPLREIHYPGAYFTRSYSMEETGLWVGGGDVSGGMVNELLNEGQWNTLPVNLPYENIDYPNACSVPLNSTHICIL